MRWVPLAVAVALPALSGAAEPSVASPVLVELFTSEGCSSCPVADEALADLSAAQDVAGAEVVPLELHVDYWNRLGWTDPFSAPEFTERQEAYAQAFHRDGVYTPQMLVDGTSQFVGEHASASRAVALAARVAKSRLVVSSAPAPGGLDVQVQVPTGTQGLLLVAVTESSLSSRVQSGENRGRTLRHAPVTRVLVPAGPVHAGSAQKLRIALGRNWARQRLRVVAFVQDPSSLRVVGVGTAAVPAAKT